MQVILQRGLSFEVKMPAARLADVSVLSDAEAGAEPEKLGLQKFSENISARLLTVRSGLRLASLKIVIFQENGVKKWCRGLKKSDCEHVRDRI